MSRSLAPVSIPAVVIALLIGAAPAHARPPAPALVALAPPAGDDARTAIAIGPRGEVFAPDGKGAWTRERAITTADRVTMVGRASSVVALADGAVYRLADNGWSALRLVQKGKAVMSSGSRAVAAVGRQLFALDRTVGGEPAKLALAPQPVLAIGTGVKAIVVATERGLLRLEGAGWKPIARAPRRVDRLVDDRWAVIERGAVDLKTGAVTAWPGGLRVDEAAVTIGPKGVLLAAGTTAAGPEVITIAGKKLTREPITDMANGIPIGIAADRAGRIVVAFRDGTLAVRDRGAWTRTTIVSALPAPRPGARPATSP